MLLAELLLTSVPSQTKLPAGCPLWPPVLLLQRPLTSLVTMETMGETGGMHVKIISPKEHCKKKTTTTTETKQKKDKITRLQHKSDVNVRITENNNNSHR